MEHIDQAARRIVAVSRAEHGDCRDAARIHRQLAEDATKETVKAAHLALADAFHARAGSLPEDAQPGDPCGIIGPNSTFCAGQLECMIDARGEVPDCHCHISPPCHVCMTAPLVCDTCDEEVG